jgi:hypothetical protein
MPHYKAPDNSLHFLDDAAFAHLLPAGSVAITDAEAEEIRAANTPATTYAQLRASAYPPLFDLIDGLVKNDQEQIEAYRAECLAVKARYPKPAA